MIKRDSAVLVVVRVLFEQFDHYLNSLGLDMIEVLLFFGLAVLIPFIVNEDSVFLLSIRYGERFLNNVFVKLR